jgi:hypothetical protein
MTEAPYAWIRFGEDGSAVVTHSEDEAKGWRRDGACRVVTYITAGHAERVIGEYAKEHKLLLDDTKTRADYYQKESDKLRQQSTDEHDKRMAVEYRCDLLSQLCELQKSVIKEQQQVIKLMSKRRKR